MAAPKNLPAEIVLDIYFSSGKQKMIAWSYGVSQGTVSKIKSGSRYGRITAPYSLATGAEKTNATLISAAFGAFNVS